MKRGLIAWDKSELPPAAFESRVAAVRKTLAERDLPALVIYTDVWRSNQGRHFTNFMPYWNRALIVLRREGAPVLLCALSPRVYPWIRSLTILDEIRPSGNLTQKLLEMCSEEDWKSIGVLDLARFPNDLSVPLQAGNVQAVNVPASSVWPWPDEWEISMHRHAAQLARRVLTAELSKADGCLDHEVSGRLEGEFRRAGAEDLVILFSDGQTPPHPPTGLKFSEGSSVAVALEYRGHWIKLSRPHPSSSLAEALQSRFASSVKDLGAELTTPAYVETLSGPYPFESCEPAEIEPGTLFAFHLELQSNGHRSYYGDTGWRGLKGAELL
jgi:hypothetical protein